MCCRHGADQRWLIGRLVACWIRRGWLKGSWQLDFSGSSSRRLRSMTRSVDSVERDIEVRGRWIHASIVHKESFEQLLRERPEDALVLESEVPRPGFIFRSYSATPQRCALVPGISDNMDRVPLPILIVTFHVTGAGTARFVNSRPAPISKGQLCHNCPADGSSSFLAQAVSGGA